jgi:ketosteroid isomerase-like protein
MSSNTDLVRSIYAEQKRGEGNPARWAHPEIEFVFADGPTPGTWTGVAALIEVWRDYLRAFEDYYSEIVELRELDDERVLVFDHVRGRARSSGVELGQISPKGGDLWHVRDGKVVRVVLYFDRDRMLADLGLEPEGNAKAPDAC